MPFKALGLHPLLIQATQDMRYQEPTPIQAESIPAILTGRDVLATAQTGTGKTASYLLPILHKLLSLPKGTTQALVLTPTRELAQQVDDVFLALAYHTPIRTGVLVGGSAMTPQEKALRAGVEVLVATPGRLLDHMRLNQARFDQIHTLVLDEADRMLDMGFLPDLKRVLARLPARKQTLLFSATMPPVIARLAGDILRNPITISIGRRSAPAVGITQAAYPVPDSRKSELLHHLLRNNEMQSVLIFTRTKRSARKLAREIALDGFAVGELHSDLTQPQRTRAMEKFRKAEFQVLVATNIAARGLDVDHITHVISFDVPMDPDDYIHRIGRTARAGAEGDAWILVSPLEEKSLTQIERQVGNRLPRITLPDFDYKPTGPEGTGRQGGGRSGSKKGGVPGRSSHQGSTGSRSRRPGKGGPGQSGRGRGGSGKSGPGRGGSSSGGGKPRGGNR